MQVAFEDPLMVELRGPPSTPVSRISTWSGSPSTPPDRKPSTPEPELGVACSRPSMAVRRGRMCRGGTGFLALAADPSRPGVVYSSVFRNLSNGSIMKSTDGGATWTTVFPTTAAIYKIIIDPVNPDVLYLPTVGHGAWKSIDGGQHWSAMTALTPQAIWTMALDPANSQVLYAGTNQDRIWKSTDAGNTLQQAGSVGPFPVYSLAVDSSTHIVYAGTNGGGVWTGLHDGVTWRATTIADGMVLSLAVDSAGAVYAGTNLAGAKVSHDQGTTWTALNTGTDHESKSCSGIWIDPKNYQKMFPSQNVWVDSGSGSRPKL